MNGFVPGTIITLKPNKNFMEDLFRLSVSGLVMSQIKQISGLETSAIQNWVKRGWVPPAIAKHYNMDQVSRILMINALRGTMQMESIVRLLSYVNGNLLDTKDDTIPDSRLYALFCTVVSEIQKDNYLTEKALKVCLNCALDDYQEPISGAKERLFHALFVMALSYQSGCMKEKAATYLEKILE